MIYQVGLITQNAPVENMGEGSIAKKTTRSSEKAIRMQGTGKNLFRLFRLNLDFLTDGIIIKEFHMKSALI